MALEGSLGCGGKCVKRWLRAGCRICTRRGSASESVIESVCASGVRRMRMGRVVDRLAVAALGLCLGGPWTAQADNRPVPKGPDDDGTKPALVKIAGEGMM